MFIVRAENECGNSLTLTDNPMYSVIVTGLSPSPAAINTAVNGSNDGSIFNSSRVNQRNIVIIVRIIENLNVEAARIRLYSCFKSKKPIRLYITTELRNVYIDGYVENMDCDIFTNAEQMQISIICPFPFFRDVKESVSEMSIVTPLFSFPFSIPAEGVELSTVSDFAAATVYNGGDIESGMKIELYAHGDVINPSIIDAETLERFDLNFEMMSGDKIIINTVKNERSVNLIRYGVTLNIINAIGKYPDWLQLDVGENSFTYVAESGAKNLTATFKHTDLFQGV